jgi:hypothetical protein
MEFKAVDHAIEWLEKANANLQPELLVSGDARRLLERYARVERLATLSLLRTESHSVAS